MGLVDGHRFYSVTVEHNEEGEFYVARCPLLDGTVHASGSDRRKVVEELERRVREADAD